MNKQHTELIDRLEATGQELARALGGVSERALHAKPEDGGWTLHQQICHLRDCETQIFLVRARLILKQDRPAVENFDQDAYMRKHYVASQPLPSILAEFRNARRQLVRLLRATTDKDWTRTAVHPEYGVISLEWQMLHNYAHTLDHLAHILSRREGDLLRALNP